MFTQEGDQVSLVQILDRAESEPHQIPVRTRGVHLSIVGQAGQASERGAAFGSEERDVQRLVAFGVDRDPRFSLPALFTNNFLPK